MLDKLFKKIKRTISLMKRTHKFHLGTSTEPRKTNIKEFHYGSNHEHKIDKSFFTPKIYEAKEIFSLLKDDIQENSNYSFLISFEVEKTISNFIQSDLKQEQIICLAYLSPLYERQKIDDYLVESHFGKEFLELIKRKESAKNYVLYQVANLLAKVETTFNPELFTEFQSAYLSLKEKYESQYKSTLWNVANKTFEVS